MVFFYTIGLMYSLSIPEQYDIMNLADWEPKNFGMLKTTAYLIWYCNIVLRLTQSLTFHVASEIIYMNFSSLLSKLMKLSREEEYFELGEEEEELSGRFYFYSGMNKT